MNAVSSFPLLPNPYKILKQIGSGSFGNVYLAENSENGKYCVVKELYFVSQEPKFMAKARDLFRQEAETLAKLSHPQIPHLITHAEIDGELGKIEYQQAQKMINNLSRKIFNEAQNLYEEQGDFEGAREKINLITDRQNRDKAREKLKQWEDNYKENTYYQNEAEKDLLYENCQEVINTARKMGGTNYWRLKRKITISILFLFYFVFLHM